MSMNARVMDEIVGATAVRICQALLNVTVEMDTTTLLLLIFATVRILTNIVLSHREYIIVKNDVGHLNECGLSNY